MRLTSAIPVSQIIAFGIIVLSPSHLCANDMGRRLPLPPLPQSVTRWRRTPAL
jgi:hypothetical protein